MPKKTILLIEDDPKTEAAIRDALGRGYNLHKAKGSAEAAAILQKKPADLILIDFDLKQKDGLQIYRELRPKLKVIMLSASGNVPLAVTATKQGVVEFLRKPISGEELREAVERNMAELPARLRWPKGAEWLRGESKSIQEMLGKIRLALRDEMDIVLNGERGIPKKEVAEFIHLNSPQQEKKLECIDLNSFSKESLELHFWTNVKRFLSLPDAKSLQRLGDLCGTLYLDNLEKVDEHFRASIFSYFAGTKKDVRVVFGFSGDSLKVKEYVLINVPPLRDRKEDLPGLLEFYLKKASARFNKEVKYVSADVLGFLAGYDFPGNYLELLRMIEEAVLAAKDEKLESSNFPYGYRGLMQTALNSSLGESLTLEEAKRRFEKKLYQVLLNQAGGDEGTVARFMDVPKAVLAERFQDLSD
jgi:DNA-binding NtrC family response regulator